GRDGELLHSFQGDRAHDAFGASVAAAGDVDGDGLDDVVVGAEQHAAEAEGGGEGSGYVRVFSGADGGLLLEVPGSRAGDRFGAAVAGVGDLDGDGRADLLVGARARAGGYALALSGADGRVIHRFDDLRDPTRNDVRVHAIDDQDGDGVRELLVSTPNATHVYSGRSGAPLLTISAAEGALDRAGDLDGDGKDELVFRRYRELGDRPSEHAATTATFYSGADGRLLGEVPYAPPGAFRPLNPIADLDGDGRGDLVVLIKGRVWVLSGAKLLGSS
ncbi:MAG: FG-GAP-like repeat-containing protein, partial [Planctomycetota bacterium]|nr:FG-GAP-like repeat-containing protein [Planctomycetota bacterium]